MWTSWKKNCDGSEPQYEYYDLDVGLGIHDNEEEENFENFESSGDGSRIFDMPKFEMLIGDESPRPGKNTGNSKNPYTETTGPLVAATLYRKYEFSQEISNIQEEEKVEKTTATNNIFG